MLLSAIAPAMLVNVIENDLGEQLEWSGTDLTSAAMHAYNVVKRALKSMSLVHYVPFQTLLEALEPSDKGYI